MTINKETVDRLFELALEAGDKKVISNDAGNFTVGADGRVTRLLPENLSKDYVSVSTLTGIVDLIKHSNELSNKKLFVQITRPNEVRVMGALDEFGRRELLFISLAQLPDISFDQFMSSEYLNIMLQSQFVETDDRNILLKVIGNLKEETVSNTNDDGVSQGVTIKSGVASVAKVKVPNPVILAPYRTFNEVEQPESKFIFRMHEGMQGAIFEADGGAWKNEALQNIKVFLQKALSDEMKNQRVVVIA